MTANEEAELYLVDVCGTLVHDDTTLGLLEYHFSRDTNRRARYRFFRAITAGRSPLRLAFVLAEKLTGKHLLKHVAVSLLAGEDIDVFEKNAKQYAAFLLSTRRVDSVWPLIEGPLLEKKVVFASSSLEPVVASLAEATGARHVASSLEQDNGILTGRYGSDLTGRKELALVEKFGRDVLSRNVCAISDNLTDRPLLERAAKAYVVLRRSSHRQRWRGLDATFLEAGK